jgi:hypothetical protein
VVAGAAILVSGCTLNRPEDPVVIRGIRAPTLLTAAAGDVVAFRWVNGWDQVPVQVDERKQVDLGQLYDPALPAVFTVYADPSTFVGADSDPRLDSDDEIAFMAKDLGLEAPADAGRPSGVAPGNSAKVKVRSTLGGETRDAWIYLFQRTGGLSPGAGESYVSYDSTTVTTPFYTTQFSGRWVPEVLRVKTGEASEVDILDREKIQFYPGECSTNESDFDSSPDYVIAHRTGPVRAIRSIVGAASGQLTQRDRLFYQQREDTVTHLRVHGIAGIMNFLDYSAAAIGMTYRNNANPDGVTIDGNPDPVKPARLSWETVDGPQGGLSIVHSVDTDIANLSLSSYYLDDSTPDQPLEAQCTGDAAALGSSGPRVDEPIPNTDPRGIPLNFLTSRRTTYFEAPGEADGPAREAQASSPFEVAVSSGP